MTQEELFKILVAHCKEYGFIFPSSEIYDGLGAVYDYGQLGSELKNNIKRYWWEAMTRNEKRKLLAEMARNNELCPDLARRQSAF